MNKKLIITEYRNCLGEFLFEDNEFVNLYFSSDKSIVGNIYTGIIKNKIHNLNAAFVEFQKGKMAFLPLNEKQTESVNEGDICLIQIEKDAIKSKDPLASLNLSRSGLYCVITTQASKNCLSFSKKINQSKKKEIQELFYKEKNLIEKLREYRFSAIVRSSVNDQNNYHNLLNEMESLIFELNKIKEQGIHRSCCSAIYDEKKDYLKQILKFQLDFSDEIVTDQLKIYEECQDLGFPCKIRLYDDETYPLAKLYSIETKMEELFYKQIYLKNGGTIVIEYTEALTVIDVNTSKNVKKSNADKAAFETNIEAAKEIAKQLILRNISGIIIVDYINMKNTAYKEALITRVKELCKKDMIQCDYIDFTPLGLLEMTRKKISAPLHQYMT